jgi:hypothetical protein
MSPHIPLSSADLDPPEMPLSIEGKGKKPYLALAILKIICRFFVA